MSLPIGTRIGSCEIVGPIGKGGMGEVYRARDSRLGRDVAIKILPAAFSDDVDRVTRFEREARTLAALNHPNIAVIYGLEQVINGLEEQGSALMMEFVDGDDLARRIARGPIPIGDALAIARQITDALEAAHEQGIVHRDLKPANVIVRHDSTVKLIDFGLAKAREVEARGTSDAGALPTFTAAPTERGAILGTPAYMSPEQARGRPVDKRTDIWAFGVVVFEMLTGGRAFAGERFPDVLAAVIAREINWKALPPGTPPALRALLERCLDPDPKQRLRDIGEARVAITAIERGGAGLGAVPSPRQTRLSGRESVAWTVAAASIAVATALVVSWRLGWIGSPPAPPSQTSRLSVMPPAGMVLNPDSSNLAISPDGRMVAFVVGSGVSVENQLWVRAIDSEVARRIESGDGVSLPFWSPDSKKIGFFAGRKLKTVAASGGRAQVLGDAPFGRGGTWGATNVIVFAPDANGPLYRVSGDGGGAPVPATTLDAERQETTHRFPLFLPDGDRFLYPALPAADGLFDIFAGSLANPNFKTRVGSMESAPAFAEPGSLLFTRQGVLVTQAFDTNALTLSGTITSLGDEPRVAPGTAAYDAGRRVSASTHGSLAFVPDPAINTALEWRDLSGKVVSAIPVPAARYVAGSLAPDESRAALVRPESGAPSGVWIVDLARSTAVPVGTTMRGVGAPAWSPDSRRLAFVDVQNGRRQLSVKTVADVSPPQRIAGLTGNSALVRSWVPGEFLLNQIDPGTRWNIYRLQETGTGEPTPVVQGPGIDAGGWLSPTRRWIAYLSDEGGRFDLWVQPYPNGGAKQQISTTGVQSAWWNRDDGNLLYLTRDQTLWRVDVTLTGDGAPRIGTPAQLGTFPATLIAMDFAAERQQFLALVPDRSSMDAITIVQAWRAATR